MNSFLYPKKWHKRYSELLDVSVSLLTEVVELTDKPDFERETFHHKPIVIESETLRIENKIYSYHCDRCNGQGIIPKYMHIANGVCFKCYGSSKSKVMVA
jgi:formylmethanofuran dehydrogenase subunit E